ncbi:gamma-glutamylcyclotransferase family protein [Aliikangiella coralliicola]|uniref:Gamma-glutamylcyclotransferase n=1 Tax=Aliikangiella coralliicola TaxID=2592383 RepID=A0A545U7U2_9GAMM|nr:gamma-glutamylcyclotransferase family protein [Aliikangiella coralliicola]TQV85542.1 gamma-glutamylcyclotransferase [Aliikangiella coralliicola]
MKYFAYGSNMSLSRLRQRVPSAKLLGAYKLAKHDLRFHKVSKDGSGKCDAFDTGSKDDFIIGVLFDIDAGEKPQLDKAEGLGYGYNEKEVTVVDDGQNVETAVTYYATKINDELTPYTWYKHHVLVGARDAKLPADYVQKIESIPAIEDPDTARESKQMAIYD